MASIDKEELKKARKEAKKKAGKIGGEFKKFIMQGDVVDLAVGVIIGGAFQGLVSSLTDNIISPILGCFSEVDFTEYVLKIGNLNLKYGAFLTDVINFIIMAFVVFIIIKVVNKMLVKKQEPQEELVEIESDEVKILKEIRDELKKNKKN